MRKDEITIWVRAYYDKFILVVVLAAILVSLSILIYNIRREKKTLAEEQPGRVPPAVRVKQPAMAVQADDTLETLACPFQLGGWTTRMVVAELRVSCVKCGQPIPFNAEICPFRSCRAAQPRIIKETERDSDADKMPDVWEKKYGLNINMDDASQDPDQDGFTNLEEYRAGTNPNDPDSAPAPVTKLRVLKTGQVVFPLVLNGIMKSSSGDWIFMIRNRPAKTDYTPRLGETVHDYKLESYDEKTRKLIVAKDGKQYVLTENAATGGQREEVAQLVYQADNSVKTYKKGDIITLKTARKKYDYKIVDINDRNVIVADMQSGSEIMLEPAEGAGK
jgi:hypothetical protein